MHTSSPWIWKGVSATLQSGKWQIHPFISKRTICSLIILMEPDMFFVSITIIPVCIWASTENNLSNHIFMLYNRMLCLLFYNRILLYVVIEFLCIYVSDKTTHITMRWRWSITPYIVWIIWWQINQSCHKMGHKCFLIFLRGSHDSQSPHIRT